MSSSTTGTFAEIRVAIVTGAGQGIGRAIALRLASDGLNVTVNDIPSKQSQLEEVVQEIQKLGRGGLAVPGDVAGVVAIGCEPQRGPAGEQLRGGLAGRPPEAAIRVLRREQIPGRARARAGVARGRDRDRREGDEQRRQRNGSPGDRDPHREAADRASQRGNRWRMDGLMNVRDNIRPLSRPTTIRISSRSRSHHAQRGQCHTAQSALIGGRPYVSFERPLYIVTL